MDVLRKWGKDTNTAGHASSTQHGPGALPARNTGLAHLSNPILSAQESERARISRELHDQVGQSLTAIILGLRSASVGSGAEWRLTELAQLASRTLEDVRRITFELRLPRLGEDGIEGVLSSYAAELRRRYGTEIEVWVEAEQEPDVATGTVIYRVAQEAFTNAVRHAQASVVTLTLRVDRRQATLTVDDDGIGFDGSLLSPRQRLGIDGMRERVESVGGRLEIDSRRGEGTCLTARLPLEEGRS